jgi:ferredoxin-NADP reductase
MKIKVKKQIEGYREIESEIAVLRKYSVRPTNEKGQVYEAIDRYHPSRLKLIVSEIIKETESTSTLRLIPESGYLPPFQAGQYINLFLEINGITTSRPYSISSPPNQVGYYDISIRRQAEGFVSDHLLGNIEVGSLLTSTSPAGNFCYNPLFHGQDLVFIAGGSGITPFMSMIREVADCGKEQRIHLIYGSRTPSDIIFKADLEDREKRHGNLKVTHVISEPAPDYKGESGFITAKLINRIIDSPLEKMFYVCGPEALYSFVLKELEAIGIPKRKIRVEVFGPPARIDQQPGWPEQVKRDDRFRVRFSNGFEFEAVAGESLLNSLERSGKALPTSCRSGECSLCRTKLLSGKVFQPATVKLRKSDRQYNYIHPCMAYPLEDLELML